MQENEMLKILQANNTNRYIINNLDDKTLDFVMQVLLELPADAFKEINPDAQFDLTDIPIPYEKLESGENVTSPKLSQSIEEEVKNLLSDINTEGKNIEYPYVFEGKNHSFENFKRFSADEKNSQSCTYDWEWIENEIKSNENISEFALFHTHPNPLGANFNTLYNMFPDQLKAFGIKPDGLNISLADVYANMYADNLIKENQRDIKPYSFILMHNGDLLSFSTSEGFKLESLENETAAEEDDYDFLEL